MKTIRAYCAVLFLPLLFFSGVAFFTFTPSAHATTTPTISSALHAGVTTTAGGAYHRSDFTSFSQYWTFNFTWPNEVYNNKTLIAVLYTPVGGSTYTESSVTNQYFSEGVNSLNKSISLPSLGTTTAPSGTYTIYLAETASNNTNTQTLLHFTSNGAEGTPAVASTTMVFTYTAEDEVTLVENAFTNTVHNGLTILNNDTVLLNASSTPTTYWTFNFTWPNSVTNANTILAIFNGTFGSTTSPLASNYSATNQTFVSGANSLNKAFSFPSLHAPTTTTPYGTYTLLVAERNPKDSASSFSDYATWFSSGGVSGTPPLKYATMEFTYSQYAECCSSVIFLPGFEGSILKTGSNTLWPPTLGDVDGDLGKLAFNSDGTPVESDVVVGEVINTFYTYPVYQGFSSFMDTLVAVDSETGTSTIKEWEAFPYDWRLSPDDIVQQGIKKAGGIEYFVDELEALASNSYTGKVSIVAHSYGGLVGKALIKELQAQGKEDLVESFVMVGTPQLGTPQAAAGLLHGEGSDLEKNVQVIFTPWAFKVALVNKKQARTLGHNLEGAYALLPSREYFNRVNERIIDFEPVGPYSEEWRKKYSDKGIRTFNEFVSFLIANFVPRTGGVSGAPVVLNSSLVTKAENTHIKYDTFSFPESLRVVQIAGWGLPTIKGILYSGDIETTNYSVSFTEEGDKTVVYPSAITDSYNGEYFLNLGIYNIDPSLDDYTHLNLLSFPPALDMFRSVFTDSPIQESIFITKEKPKVEFLRDKLIVSAHSPVTLGVTDQFGNYTGITPNQDPNADILTITTDIPGSSYFTVGDAKYITLPEDGEYSFVMSGTGEGDVTVLIETLSLDNQATTATFSNFTVSVSTQATLHIVGGVPSSISLDQDGDGVVDETVLSDADKAAQAVVVVETPIPVVSSGGGGGILWKIPIATTTVEIKKEEYPSLTTTEVIVETNRQVIEEEPLVAAPVLPVEDVVEAEVPAMETEEPAQPMSPSLNQQALAIQSGWYDKIMGFIKQTVINSVRFFNSLF